jgi:GNAT superfamily N-acetyltransferase
MRDGLVLRTRAYSDELNRAAILLEDEVWSPLGYLNFTQAHREHYDRILENFADLQLCLVDEASQQPVALANCVPTAFDGDADDLPAEGWDWLVESGACRKPGRRNVLGALAISVPHEQRRKGYAQRMIRELRGLAERRGFDALIAPVRPSAKADHPFVAMEEYLRWQDDEGRLFDPWLRTHLSQGGKLIGPCERSMVVHEHLAFWETWAGRRFATSGSYALGGALVPVSIDVERQSGRYEEPNVWVSYAS